MKTIKQMKEDVAAILRELGNVRDLCTRENRTPSAEEIVFANGKLAEVEELEECIKLEERTQRALAHSEETDGEVDKPEVSDKQRKVRDERENFATQGEFYQAVMRAGSPGGYVDPRLSTRVASGLQEGVPSDGGFLVDTQMSNELLKNVWSSGMILPRVSKVSLSGNANAMKFNGLDETSRVNGSRAGGILAYWGAEAGTVTATKPKFRKIELSLNKLIGICYATDELMEDASALAQTLNEGFRDEFDFRITDAIINGTGVGQPLGIMNSGCMVSVSKESGQAADSILYDNLNKMWSRLMAASRPNSIWLINQDCEPQLHQMSLAIGTGGSAVYLPAGGAAAQPYSTLFGRPVVPVEQCQTVGTSGDVILADFSKYKMIDKGGMKNDVSLHVRFLYDEQTFRFTYRCDGQPVLGSAITPFKGTDTLSHFVKLNSRD